MMKQFSKNFSPPLILTISGAQVALTMQASFDALLPTSICISASFLEFESPFNQSGAEIEEEASANSEGLR